MADEKRKVFFMKLKVRMMLSREPVTDCKIIQQDIFDIYVSEYEKAEKKADFASFSVGNQETGELMAVTKLQYAFGMLCGVIGRCSKNIKGFMRERDMETFDTHEILPSTPQAMFEEYSFFAISPKSLKFAYLKSPGISSSIPKTVLCILRRNSANGLYEVELSELFDHDIKTKLKEMRGNVKVTGWIEGKDKMVSDGMASLRELEGRFATKISTRIKISARIKKIFSDEDASEIIRLSALDDGYSSICFTDEQEDKENEIIDVVKKQVVLSKEITISSDEKKDTNMIWRKLCQALQ